CNLSPVPRERYQVGLPYGGRWREAINTDSEHYGGSNVGNYGGVAGRSEPWRGRAVFAEAAPPPARARWPRPPPAGPRVPRGHGAVPAGDGTVEFRVWAPNAKRVTTEAGELEPEGGGVFAARLPGAAGDEYWFRPDGGKPLPDPCSRWQPGGLRGPSAVLDTG